MAWWDHEELKFLENRSERYVLEFSDEYPHEYVREIALQVLNYKNAYPSLRELAEKRLTYGLKSGEKPRFRVKAKSIRS